MSAQISEPFEGSITIGADTAEQWSAHYRYSGQRPFRQWHADNLSAEMKAGRFRPKTQIAFARFDGQLYCTNGQHTLAAISRSKTSQLVSVVINECSSMAEVADDFSRHDTHLTRKFADSLVAHDVHKSLGVSVAALQVISAGAIFYESLLYPERKIQSTNLTHDEKMRIVLSHGDLGRDALYLFEGSIASSYLTRKTTLASAMLTLRAKPDTARDYWRAIALDDGLRARDPRKQILTWLMQHVTTGGAYGSLGKKKPAADHELMKGIAASWNAFVGGRELAFIRVDFNAHMAVFDGVGAYKVRSEVRKDTKEQQ